MLTRSLLPIAMLGLMALPTAAQEPAALDDLQAHRIDAEQVQITFSYEGGACEEVDPAETGETADGKLPVTFPATSTAEICTMQVVIIEVDQTIAADESVDEVDVTLLAPDGSVVATGAAPIGAH